MPLTSIGNEGATATQQAVRSPYQIWVGWPPEMGSAPPMGMDPNVVGGGITPPASYTDTRPTVLPGDVPTGDNWGGGTPPDTMPISDPFAPNNPNNPPVPPVDPNITGPPGDTAGRAYGKFRKISSRGGPEFQQSNTADLLRKAAARRLGLE